MLPTEVKPKELDWREPQKVKYAAAMWQRDEQIKHATTTITGRIQPVDEPRPEPIAVVGFGPSLQDTWEKLKEFKYIITCSGSHKFLLERGITPTWHVEVDPRNHKITLLGVPHKDVEYLIASTCHPDYFKHLEGFNVKLWHIFDASEDGLRMLPPGEWAVMGGCDAGLRAMTLAGFLGFRNLHIFGLDGSAREADAPRHAADHPNGKQKYSTTNYKGKIYYTTPAMLEAARQTAHELEQMPVVKATFYGEGLTQAMVKGFKPSAKASSKPFSNIVGYTKPELISSEYIKLNSQLHKDNLAYGVGGGKHADVVAKLVASLKTTSVLDYGCGKGYLAKSLDFPIWEYDPAIPEKSAAPRPADIVVCTDVLEHVEPDNLVAVLYDLARCVKKVGYFVINTGPAQKTLADGRNTHLIQRNRAWWKQQLERFFGVAQLIEKGSTLHAVVAPKAKKKKKVA